MEEILGNEPPGMDGEAETTVYPDSGGSLMDSPGVLDSFFFDLLMEQAETA